MKRVYLVIGILVFCFNSMLAQEISGKLKGLVYDEDSRKELSGASIVLLCKGVPMGTISDESGHFMLENIPIGRYDVSISYLGYEPVLRREILIGSAKDVVIEVGLKELVTKLKEVVVEGKKAKDLPINSMALVSSKSFTVEQTRRYAGGIDDPARMVSSFAGVISSSNPADNRIVVRGNSPRGIVWRLDGVEIPNPNHFGQVGGSGGGVTVFSGQLLSNSDFYSSAFSAEYGNGLAAVFDMRLRNGNTESYEHAFQIGIQGVEFASEGPLNTKTGASYLFNYRYSLLGIMGALLYSQQGAVNEFPVYQDLSFKLNFPTKNAGTFSLFGIGGIGSTKNVADSDSLQWDYVWQGFEEVFQTKMGAVSLSHLKSLSNSTYIKSALVASGNDFDIYQRFSIPSLSGGFYTNDVDYSESRMAFSSLMNHKVNARISLRGGFVLNRMTFDSKVNVQTRPDEEVFSLINDSGNGFLSRVFVQSKWNITRNWYVTGGIHAMHFSVNQKTSIEPRVATKVNLGNHSLSFGYGKHSQIESLGVYYSDIKTGAQSSEQLNKNLDYTKAHHLVMQWDWYLSKNIHLKIEPYVQFLYNVPVKQGSSYSLLNLAEGFVSDSLINEGSGKNIGLDITLERFLADGYYYMFTASLFDSKYKGGDDVERNTRFNSKYALNALFGKEFVMKKKQILSLNAKIHFLGGEYYSPLDISASESYGISIYNEDDPFSEKLDGFYGLDLTVNYRIHKKKHASIWALQIKNALNSKPASIPYYDAITGSEELIPTAGIMPFLSYKLVF